MMMILLFAGQAVPAHCCILSACSPFFTERLEREMPPKGHKVVLEIRGLKIETLRKLVDFLYTSEMEVSREEAQDILAAARQLQVSALESLQLEGGKLVKKSLGPRLNRDCLQVASPVSIPETSLVYPPAVCGGSSLTSLVVACKQHTVVKLPCTKDSDNSNDHKQSKKQKPAAALLSGDKQQIPKGPAAPADTLRTKGKKRATGMLRISSTDETYNLQIAKTGAGEREGTASFQETKKIKLSRSKLSSPPLSVSCATKDHNKSSGSARRLWRQKTSSKDGMKGAKDSSHLQGFWSPPRLSKSTKGRKRNVSEPASSLNLPSETGQIGRVKLRKVINGGCWEVVQESPTVPTRATNVYALQEEAPQSHPDCPKTEIVDAQEPASSAKLPAKQGATPCFKKNLVEQDESMEVLGEESSASTPYELNVFTLEHLTGEEQYGSVASNGELEHMLDLLLADDDALGESQVITAPDVVHLSGPSLEVKKSPLGIAAAEEGCSADTSICQPLVETGDRSLKWEEEEAAAPDLEIDKESNGSANGVLLMNPVLGSLHLLASEPRHDSLASSKPASLPELDNWAVPEDQLTVLEDETARFSEALAVITVGDKDQELLSHTVGISAPEAQPHTQVVLRNPLQHTLDCKLLPLLASLEEEELDVGGVEELFVSIECVRPDLSPMSETEVDVLS